MRAHRALVTIVLGLFLVGAGCSGSSDDDSKSSDTGGNGQQAETGTDAEGDATGGGDVSEDGGDDASSDADDGGADADTGVEDTSNGDDAGDAGADGDAGPDCNEDSDSDGIDDCDEAELCTDPNDGDTDGDHLSDFEELQNQTDPCSKDTDGDGATDREEVRFGLDPNRPKTDGETRDGNRWILSACENPQSEPVDFYESRRGNWKIALPPAFNNYKEVTIQNAGANQAAAVYDDPANEVAGVLLSKEAVNNQTSPTDPISTRIPNKVDNVATIDSDFLTGEFDTHDRKKAASVEYILSVSGGTSVRRLRDELLFALAPYGKSDVSGLPNSAGAQHTTFRAEISVVQRSTSSGKKQNLLSVAVAPNQKYKNIGKVKFRLDDLTNTTNVSESVDTHLTKCEWDKPDEKDPKVEFYWVLDQSGSMDTDNGKVKSFGEDFEKEIRNTSLEYRLGVTNMVPKNNGRLHLPDPGWHQRSEDFKQEIEKRVISCQQSSSWECDTVQEHGLEVARKGLRHMLGAGMDPPSAAERIRSNAEVITIFMGDEPSQGKDDGVAEFFKGRSKAFAIMASEQCGQGTDGKYEQVALESGGASADLCKGDLTKTLEKIILEASGLASEFALGRTPVSSSLRVYLNGQWVPRNRQNGFDYFPQKNSIAFFGDFRPKGKDEGDEGETDYVAISFETYKDRCKESGGQSCQSGGGNN